MFSAFFTFICTYSVCYTTFKTSDISIFPYCLKGPIPLFHFPIVFHRSSMPFRAYTITFFTKNISAFLQLLFAVTANDKKRINSISDGSSNFEGTNNFPTANGIMRAAVCDFPGLKAQQTFWLLFVLTCMYVRTCTHVCNMVPRTSTCISNLATRVNVSN